MISDIHMKLKASAAKPVQRTISPVEQGSASHKLKDGRRVTCSVRVNSVQKRNNLFYEWFIDGIAVDEVIAKVALANG